MTETGVDGYIEALPEERRQVLGRLRALINRSLPPGFEEAMSYGMPGWVVPHARYPAGYHCDPKLPLPFLSIASQKNYVALYHMGLYALPDELAWFTEQYAKRVKGKLDMGKSCIRFKKPEQIPYELLAELASRITVDDWIACYEQNVKR